MVTVVAARPTTSEMRAPWISQVRMSRPAPSAPSRCLADGGASRSTTIISSTSYGVSTSAKIAHTSSSRMMIAPTRPSGFSRTSRTKKSATGPRKPAPPLARSAITGT